MAFSNQYRKQVSLLVKILPHVATEVCFALKGGTAINLFLRNLPRLSVDIDLTYLPLKERSQSLAEIEHALWRIAQRIRQADSGIHIIESAPRTQKEITKLVARTKDRAQTKIEVTPVLRGCVYDPVLLPVCQPVEDEFGFAEMNVLSMADLYAGKIIAAPDRQHPRDLFDIKQLFENEGITDELRAALIVYLISHNHSPHSLLNPMLRDISQDFEQSFAGLTEQPLEPGHLLAARDRLIREVSGNMPDHHKSFLRSFYSGKPDWPLLGLEAAQNLPAVKWRRLNLDRAGAGAREELLRRLEGVISA